jgi:hypothetical protein
MTTHLDHRETSDTYLSELNREGHCRVILCKDGIQWIIQCQKGGPGAAWRALGYCTSREALMRLWAAENRTICPELLALPHTVRRARHG